MTTLLSQDEIEALLDLVQAVRSESAVADAHDAAAGDDDVRARDFTKPQAPRREQLDFLWTESAHAATRLADALSRWLRLDVRAECTSIEPALYQTFLDGLASPCLVYPIGGEKDESSRVAISFDPTLALAAVDRVLGGTGRERFAPRQLSPVERPVADRLASAVADSLADGLADALTLERTRSGEGASHVRQARFLDGSAFTLVVTFAIAGALPESEIRLVIPATMLQRTQSQESEKSPAAATSAPPALSSVPVEVTARLGEASISLSDLLALEAGDIVPLDAETDSLATVEVEGRVVGSGQVGTVDGRLAIALTHTLEPSHRTP